MGGVNGPINYPSCVQVPLPERLYAGGSSSLRGFALNGAGPRDLLTGYPVGGTAVLLNSLELRFPTPEMRYVGDNLSLVLFHDMGNVFMNISDVGPAILRVHQPESATCGQFSNATNSLGLPVAGVCDFAYFSHTVGLGVRYKTPVGPLRVDFSYNLNPPTYPIIEDFTDTLPTPRTGQAPHFNFFFSIGQSF
jgi:outer membrane protein assembly factor BamA